MFKVIRWFFVIMLANLVTVSIVEAQGIYDSKTKTIRLSKGEKIQIQTMYFVDRKVCKGDEIPPKPIFIGKLKFGFINYRSGTTTPYQCPNITINANFADYTASDNAGVDKFKIHWKAKNGGIFIRKYIIYIE